MQEKCHSMAATDSLHQLIHSLTKAEKIFFKIYAGRYDKKEKLNQYLKLFEAIENQKQYDKSTLLKRLNDKNADRNFNQIKSYLYSNILESLRVYHQYETPDQEISTLLQSANALKNKNILLQSLRLLDQARVIAEENELFVKHIEVLSLQNKILCLLYKTSFGNYKKVIESQQAVMLEEERLQEYLVYEGSRHALLFYINKHFINRSQQDNELITQIYSKSFVMYKQKKGLSDTAKMAFYEMEIIYFILNGEYENGMKTGIALLELLKNSMLLCRQKHRYFMNIINFINTCASIKQFKPTIEPFSLAVEMLKNPEINKDESLYYLTVFSANIEIIKGNADNAIQIIADMNVKLHDTPFMKQHLEARIMVFGLYASAYFLKGEYKKALFYNEQLYDMSNKNIREDVHCNSRIFNLIVHYELGNYDYVQYLLQSTSKFLLRRNRLYELEKTIIRYINKLIVCTTYEEKSRIFKNFKHDMLQIYSQHELNNRIQHIDLPLWIESNIENKTLHEIYYEAAKNNYSDVFDMPLDKIHEIPMAAVVSKESCYAGKLVQSKMNMNDRIGN